MNDAVSNKMSLGSVADSFVTVLKPHTFKWVIKEFLAKSSVLGGSPVFSFIEDGHCFKWQIMCNLNNGWLRVKCYLRANYTRDVCVSIAFHILKADGKKICSSKPSIQYGSNCKLYINLITQSDLVSKAEVMLPQQTLTILCEIYTPHTSVHIRQSNMETTISKNANYKMATDFEKLFTSKKFCDLKIKLTDGCEYQAHKDILAARSEVFAAMFEHPMKESVENCVTIADLDSVVCEEMLRFIYTGKVSNLSGMLEELLAVADKYNLDDLKSMCEQKLFNDLSINSGYRTFFLAHRYRLAELKKQTIQFLNTNSKDCIKSAEFSKMFNTYPELLNELYVASVTNT